MQVSQLWVKWQSNWLDPPLSTPENGSPCNSSDAASNQHSLALYIWTLFVTTKAPLELNASSSALSWDKSLSAFGASIKKTVTSLGLLTCIWSRWADCSTKGTSTVFPVMRKHCSKPMTPAALMAWSLITFTPWTHLVIKRPTTYRRVN